MYVNYSSAFPKACYAKKNSGFQSTSTEPSVAPAMNIKKEQYAVVLEFAMPAVRKEDIHLRVQDSVLNLEAKRSSSELDSAYMKREFSIYPFKRSVRIPEELDHESLKAQFDQGILTVRFAFRKKEEKTIEVK